MSTAGRPTWTPAMGSDPSKQGGFRAHVPSRQISSKNAPGYNQLKVRQPGQNTSKEIKERDLKRELKEKEKKYLKSKRDQEDDQENDEQEDEQQQKLLLDDSSQQAKNKISSNEPKNIDADDTDSSDEDSSDSDNDNNDDEEEAELLKELERIKQEREEEAARKVCWLLFPPYVKEMEELAARAREQDSQALTSNPLLSGEQDFNIKKRWYDDTVFKNQAKGEIKQQKRFINDTIRNDFHKKFLHKYVQ